MKDAAKDIRGIISLIALVMSLAAAFGCVAVGADEHVEQFLAVAATAMAFTLGLASDPLVSGE